MKFWAFTNKLSWVALLAGAAGKLFYWEEASWLYLGAAVLLAVSQFIIREKGGGFVVRRLVMQQQIAGLALVAAGVMMFTMVRNEWMVAMFIGALLELYTAFRIPQELGKDK